jgi:peptidylprolyl isomerase
MTWLLLGRRSLSLSLLTLLAVSLLTMALPVTVNTADAAEDPAHFTTLQDGLKIRDNEVGTGKVVRKGQVAVVHYKGTLLSGKKFDSSYDRGEPFSFPLGAGRVIRGWDEGVAGMKVGGKRTLIIPPDLAYGSDGVPGAIPPNATLKFEVELVDVR